LHEFERSRKLTIFCQHFCFSRALSSNTIKYMLLFGLALISLLFILPKTVTNTISIALADPKIPSIQSTIINMYYSPSSALEILDSECPADPYSIDDLVGMYVEGWETEQGAATTLHVRTWQQVSSRALSHQSVATS